LSLDHLLSIPVVQEEAHVHIQERVTGVVRLEKTVHHHEQTVNEELAVETIAVEHVPINRFIDEPAQVRQEGDVTIIPVMEEIVITRKQLVLKEEIRVQRQRTYIPYQESISVRAEELRVVRLTPEEAEGA